LFQAASAANALIDKRKSFSAPPFFPGGDDWASGGAICHVVAQPFADGEHPPGMPAPSLSFCYAIRSTSNPNKTICIRI